jgi:AraC family transcriptional regulator of adaptative response/methylated-DNA-[protein]-cysteine methyltransferase
MHTNRHYELIAGAIRWIAEHRDQQPDLSLLANEMGVSPHHLQRTFQAWAGVSPKQFLKSLTRQAALDRLVAGNNVLDAALSVGLSGPGRLHDLLITTDALTPGEIRRRGSGVTLEYGFGQTLFGETLVAWSQRGLSFLGFCEENGAAAARQELQSAWSNATFCERPAEAQARLNEVFRVNRGEPLRLWLRGSPFQLKVWEALLAIPEGALASYGSLARSIGQPAAARSVGSAVGANPLAWIIPCHRVIRQLGNLGGYRWGAVTKQALIGFEAARNSSSDSVTADSQVYANV